MLIAFVSSCMCMQLWELDRSDQLVSAEKRMRAMYSNIAKEAAAKQTLDGDILDKQKLSKQLSMKVRTENVS